MKEFVLDASFVLCWCFEDEGTAETEATLTLLQNQERTAFVPTYEKLLDLALKHNLALRCKLS